MTDLTSDDGERERQLHQVIAAYLEASNSGAESDREALQRRHPELADDLRAFFANHDRLAQIVTFATFSADGQRLATGGSDDTVRVWDATTLQRLHEFHEEDYSPTAASFSADGTRLATASSDFCRVLDLTTGRELARFKPPDKPISITFSPDGRYLLTAGNHQGFPLWHLGGVPRWWDAATGQELWPLDHDRTYKPTPTYSINGECTGSRLSPDGRVVLTSSNNHTGLLWDAATGNKLFLLTGHEDGVTLGGFSPDSKLAVTASVDKTARIWDVATGRCRVVLRGHEEAVEYAVFSPNGRTVATVAKDATARLWDVTTGKELATLTLAIKNAQSSTLFVAFSGDGRRLLTFADGDARLW